MKTDFTNVEHRKHCRIAGCTHPAVHFGKVQGWCKLCRAVAFGHVPQQLDDKRVN
jgi:hypothetical protein